MLEVKGAHDCEKHICPTEHEAIVITDLTEKSYWQGVLANSAMQDCLLYSSLRSSALLPWLCHFNTHQCQTPQQSKMLGALLWSDATRTFRCWGTNQIHNPKWDVEVSALPGGVWSIHKWDLYMAEHWLCRRTHEPAGNVERRAGPSVLRGGLKVQHPAAGSAHSPLPLRPSQHSLKPLLGLPSQNHSETSKKSTKWSLLHSIRAPELSSKKC